MTRGLGHILGACSLALVLSGTVAFGQSTLGTPDESLRATTNVAIVEPSIAHPVMPIVEPAKVTVATGTAAMVGGSPVLPVDSAPRATVNSGEIRRENKPEVVSGEASTSRSTSAFYEVAKVAGSLALVLALIVGLKMGASKILGIKASTPGSNRGVRVLSRSVMGPKQQLVLLQVGRKLVLVSDSAGTVSTICEITDPDEVAELAAQASGSTASPGSKAAFGQMFSGRREQYVFEDERPVVTSSRRDPRMLLDAERYEDRDQDVPPAEEKYTDVDELEDLARRVRSLGRQFSAK